MINVKEFSVLRSEALVSRKRAIAQDFKVRGEYYSPAADRYLKRLQSYGIYCKEEKKDDWLKVIRGLINNIGLTKDYDWTYEAFLFETTCTMMEAIHGEVDWADFKDIGNKCTVGLVEDMTELLLEFSPNGIDFVDNVVREYIPEYDSMTRVPETYMAMKKQEGKDNDTKGQLIKCSNEV